MLINSVSASSAQQFLTDLSGALSQVKLKETEEKRIDEMIEEYVPKHIPNAIRLVKGNLIFKKLLVLVHIAHKTQPSLVAINVLASFEWVLEEYSEKQKQK